MDVSFPMRDANSLKLGLDRNLGEGKSGICSLPDSILKHILSFLNIKEAVQTSVLSKRWEFLWTSVPKLEFKQKFISDLDKCDEMREKFMNFAERVLLLHDSSSIHTFSLTIQVVGNRVNSWIEASLRKKVQKMYLMLYLDDYCGSFMLPRRLFACESLKELELGFSCDLKLPSFVYFPNLKILTLSKVSLVDDSSVNKLFSSCPILEKLVLVWCKWDNVKAVYISAPMLEHLKISEIHSDEVTEPNCQFMISGLRLKSFHFYGELTNEYCLLDAPSLVDANVDVYSKEFPAKRQAAYRAHKLLGELANVKDFHVSSQTFGVLSSAEELLPRLPFFHNLSHLEITLGWLMSYELLDFNIASKVLRRILHNSPHLESISLWKIECAMGDALQLEPVPPCFLTHLKAIKIRGYMVFADQFDRLNTIIKSCRVLESIDLGSKEINKNYNAILDLFRECRKSNIAIL